MATRHLIPELKCKYCAPQAKLQKKKKKRGGTKQKAKLWSVLCQSKNNLHQPSSWHKLFVSACCWALQPDVLEVKSMLFCFSLHLRALVFACFSSGFKGMSRQQKFQLALGETSSICFHCRENSHSFQSEAGLQAWVSLLKIRAPRCKFKACNRQVSVPLIKSHLS